MGDGFLYFLPDPATVSQAELLERGLGYAFDGASPTKVEVRGGPGGANGMVLCYPKSVSKPGYYRDEQTWVKNPKGDFWIGHGPTLPGAGDLARGRQLDGHWVELGDEGKWLVPAARRFQPSEEELGVAHCALPMAHRLNEEGVWVTDGVRARHRALWAIAESWWGYMAVQSSTSEQLFEEIGDVNVAGTTVLSANYRVSEIECSILGLFDSQNLTEVFNALIDWPTVKAFEKKSRMRAPGG